MKSEDGVLVLKVTIQVDGAEHDANIIKLPEADQTQTELQGMEVTR